jgi:hypothetical protein
MLMSKILGLFRRPAKVKHMLEDELFGTLTWEEDYRWWHGIMTRADGKTATLKIDGVKTDESFPEAMRSTFKFLLANEPRISDKIAVSMSELYNGTWGDGDTMTPEEMAQRISLTGVSLYDEGGGELYYEANDGLFTDHTICASIDENGEIGEPELAG